MDKQLVARYFTVKSTDFFYNVVFIGQFHGKPYAILISSAVFLISFKKKDMTSHKQKTQMPMKYKQSLEPSVCQKYFTVCKQGIRPSRYFNRRLHRISPRSSIVVTVDATHGPVEFYHLHAGIADYFHHGGQLFQKFCLQPTKWIKLSASL